MRVSKIYESSDQSTILCLGGFDSVHIGHVSLINKAISFKKSQGGIVAVTLFSFGSVLKNKTGEVFTLSERVHILEKLGVDETIRIDFDKNFARLKPIEFLNELADNRHIGRVICGEDFTFGANGSGKVELLKEYFAAKNIPVEVLPFITDGEGKKISTTAVKAALAEGDVKRCFTDYGVKYFIEGEVVYGRQEGRKLGFPTANIIPPKEKYPLKSGVYACTALIDGEEYRGITNIGDAPTFGVSDRILECHIDKFHGDLYGKTITVYFDDRIRDIKKFADIEELKRQLEKDLTVIR